MGIRIIDISGLSDESVISFGAMPTRGATKAQQKKAAAAKKRKAAARKRKKATPAGRKKK